MNAELRHDRSLIDATTLAAIECCLLSDIPFITYALPDSDSTIFFANPSWRPTNVPSADAIISFFGHNAPTVALNAELTATQLLSLDMSGLKGTSSAIEPYPHSTTQAKHRQAVEQIVTRLQSECGKTVLSRTIAGQCSPEICLNAIDRLFTKSRFAFRFAYYTPVTGSWMGASPELLGAIDRHQQFSTMALAGTRFNNEPWDTKNLEEHRMVVDYIVDRLRELALAPHIGDEETVTCGPIEHLRHLITADLHDHRCSFTDIISKLNPTPALAGYPLDKAISDIATLEAHPRNCYGGYIAVREPDGSQRAYVNLRSCQFNRTNYCIYVGGGITAHSTPEAEWAETEAKASTLLKLLAGN
jgi:isochorismate synthase